MIWNAAAFRVTIKAREIADPDAEDGVQLSGLLFDLVDSTFFDSQLAAVRRLTDNYKRTGRKGVYSLISLIKEMKDNAAMFTRANIVKAERLPIRFSRMLRQGGQKHVKGRLAEIRHEKIDALCRVTAGRRSPTDTIKPIVFDRLKRKITQACGAVSTHATKFVAHASTPESVRASSHSRQSLAMTKVWSAHEELCKAAAFISIDLLGDSFPPPLAIPAYDQFVYLDRPTVKTADMNLIRELWDAFDRETHLWVGAGESMGDSM